MNMASQYNGNSLQPGGGIMFPGQPFMSGPVADMAMQYGHTLAGQGTEYVHKNVSTLVVINVHHYYVHSMHSNGVTVRSK